MKTAAFNAASDAGPPQWSDASARALAEFWAGRLPSSFTIVDDRDDDVGQKAVKVEVTAAHLAAFKDAFVQELKTVPLRTGRYGNEFIYVSNSNCIAHDAPGGRADSAPLEAALEKAGIFDAFFSLETMWTQLYADGQIFNLDGRIEHAAQPATTFTQLKDLDFTGCRWFRRETRCLVAPLDAGQKVQTCRLAREKDSKRVYETERVGEGKVLVIPSNDTPDFNKLTTEDAFRLHLHPEIPYCFIADAATFSDGVTLAGSTLEKVGDKGQFRKLSGPLQMLEVTEAFATRSRDGYVVLQPGDFVSKLQTKEGDLFEAIPKSWTENGRRIMQPCTPDGTLIDPTVLDKPITTRKPLQIQMNGAKNP
ncbi:MAG: hypothetical protein ACAH80_09550 [Alphaproteobacteria bacterium]